jgi:hypothetical protein
MRAHIFLYEAVDPTKSDLVDVAEWLNATPDQIEVHIKQEPIDKFIRQIKEMYGTFDEFPKDERRTNKILNLLKHGATAMPMYVEQGDPSLFVMEGRHRMVAFWLAGMETVPVAYVSKKINEDSYQPPELHTGDKILKGKFKNSPAEIKGFKKDKHNQPVLKTDKGDVQLFKPRVTKLMKEEINPDITDRGFKHSQEMGEFVLTAKSSKPDHLTILCYHKRRYIGEARFVIHSNNKGSWLESDITWVDKSYRGQGIASMMYAYAKMLGNDIKPSGDQLAAGKAMWQSWKKSGEAKHLMKESEFRPMTLAIGDYRGPYHPETMRPYEGFKDSLALAEIVDNLIDNGIKPKVVTVSPRKLFATQDWLSDYGSDEASFPEYQDKPVVLNHDGKMQILDGHHRCANALKNGKMVTVYLFEMDDDLDEEKLNEYETGTDNSKQIFAKLEQLGYSLLGGGLDATVWTKDENHVIKILMPSRAIPSNVTNAEKGFLTFYEFCKAHPELPNLPRFIDIGGEHHSVFELNGVPYRQIAMERLQPIKNGSFEEAMVWLLSDLAKTRAPWDNIVSLLKKPETWALSQSMKAKMPKLVASRLQDPAVNRQYGILYLTMGRLYYAGLKAGMGWDLHTENAMMRNDGTVVIVDPFFT